jgi:hypothetical protein
LPRYSIRIPDDLSAEVVPPHGPFAGSWSWKLSPRGLWSLGYRGGWERCEDEWLARTLDLSRDPVFSEVVPGGGNRYLYSGMVAGYRGCLEAIRRGDFIDEPEPGE